MWLPKQKSPSNMKDYIQQNHSSQRSSNKHRWISRATSKKQQWNSKINGMGKTKVLSTTSTWVPKEKSKQRKEPRRRTRSKKYKSSSCWVPKNLLQMQGYYAGNSWIWIPKNILPPNPRENQVATAYKHRIQRKLQANGCLKVFLWHKSIVVSTRRCGSLNSSPSHHM